MNDNKELKRKRVKRKKKKKKKKTKYNQDERIDPVNLLELERFLPQKISSTTIFFNTLLRVYSPGVLIGNSNVLHVKLRLRELYT